MPRSLVISDSSHLASMVENAFSMAGWSSTCLGMNSMLGSAIDFASKYQCLVLVLDSEFKCRYSSVLLEMGTFVKNISRQTSLYFLLEEGDATESCPWLVYGQKLFRYALNQDDMHHAIETIMRLEVSFSINPGFVSPMDSI